MLNWARVPGISTISGAVAMTMSASAQTADPPPLLSFFKTFCADTRGDEAAIKKAVEATGSEIRRLPDIEDLLLKTKMEIWEMGAGADKITLAADSWRIPPNRNNPNERNVSDCDVLDHSHDVTGAEAIRRWVGVSPSATHVGDTEMYEYTYQEVGGTRSAVPSDRYYDTDDVWRLVVVDDARWGAISVRMSHNTIPQPLFRRL